MTSRGLCTARAVLERGLFAEGSSLAEKLVLLIHSTLGYLDSASGRPGAFVER